MKTRITIDLNALENNGISSKDYSEQLMDFAEQLGLDISVHYESSVHDTSINGGFLNSSSIGNPDIVKANDKKMQQLTDECKAIFARLKKS